MKGTEIIHKNKNEAQIINLTLKMLVSIRCCVACLGFIRIMTTFPGLHKALAAVSSANEQRSRVRM